jgi:DNA repair protein RadC
MSQLSLSFDTSLGSSLLVRDVTGDYRPANAEEVIHAARQVLAQQMQGRQVLNSPQVVGDFLRVKLGTLEHEVFAVIHLDAQHRIIDYVEMFRGTVTQTAVYPREVVKEALARNSAAMLLIHNHPSGLAEPSAADQILTQTLKAALALVDVRVLDHLIITGTAVMSFAKRGLL